LVRIDLVGASLAVMSLLLTGCGNKAADSIDRSGGNTSSRSAAAAQDVHWTSRTAGQLREAIANRAAHGLDHMAFDAGDANDGASLTKAALRYAAALARGASDPTKLFDVYTVPRPDPDLSLGLRQALAAGQVGDWLAGLAPQDPAYEALSRAYLELRREGPGAAAGIPGASEPLEPGASDARVPAIARQLVASDYLARLGNGATYTPAMVTAVRAMQADYGIKPDGVIGKDTLGILNLSDAERARAIAVNMERLRWLARTPPKTRIDVNLAAAHLSYWRDGSMVNDRKVVVGDPDHETPQLGSPVFRLVANPSWTVPRSIQKNEIAGKGAAYLRRNNMEWEDGWIVQRPGPKNSLGLVKLDMKNEYAIYLHDTPAKSLFDMVQRARSHGCVRVEDALGFALMLAKDEGVSEQWNKARASGKETFVPLPREIPVRLLYQTVLIGTGGAPIVRTDPYGWNDRVARAIGFGGGRMSQVRVRAGDVGP
jgi:murein L,D-transpeptidase YcbB/YkuD